MDLRHGVGQLYCFIFPNDLIEVSSGIFIGYPLFQVLIFDFDVMYKLEYLHAAAFFEVGEWFFL